MFQRLAILGNGCGESKLVSIIAGTLSIRAVLAYCSSSIHINIRLVGANKKTLALIRKVRTFYALICRRLAISTIRAGQSTRIGVHDFVVIVSVVILTGKAVAGIKITLAAPVLADFASVVQVISVVSNITLQTALVVGLVLVVNIEGAVISVVFTSLTV